MNSVMVEEPHVPAKRHRVHALHIIAHSQYTCKVRSFFNIHDILLHLLFENILRFLKISYPNPRIKLN